MRLARIVASSIPRRLSQTKAMTENVDATVSAEDATQVKTRLQNVSEKIASIKRDSGLAQDVRLVAVSKTKPCGLIRACFDAGHRHFGENYIQELVAKAPLLPKEINWHFIGHLQSNKVKMLAQVENLWAVETVDSEKIARLLSKEIKPPRPPLNVFIQVNTSGEDQKSGTTADEAVALATAIVKNADHAFDNIRLLGFMTIGKLGGDASADFAALVAVRARASEALNVPAASLELSMGMSSDYEIAMKTGATNVRVGSTIFGEREYHK